MSPSSRRAWIEISKAAAAASATCVALLAEGVDRNAVQSNNVCRAVHVALLAEGVDRNSRSATAVGESGRVALLAEGVDRNGLKVITLILTVSVALLAEGVDRNLHIFRIYSQPTSSPSSRRAWIEICIHTIGFGFAKVALLAEGVDRNSTRLS